MQDFLDVGQAARHEQRPRGWCRKSPGRLVWCKSTSIR